MNQLLRSTPFSLAAVLLLAGCASSSSSSSSAPPVYSTGMVGMVLSSDAGMVMQVDEVVIQASANYPGAPGAGAQVGRSAGAAIVMGNPIAAVATIGGIVGGKVGAGMDNQVGDKITIALDSGKTVTIVQPRDPKQPIMPGERVKIEGTGSGTNTRVIRETPGKDPNYASKTKPGW